MDVEDRLLGKKEIHSFVCT